MEVIQVSVVELAGSAAPYNPRQISEHDLDALGNSMRVFGIVEPVVVNKRSGNIVGGHQRVKAAAASGIDSLPVVYVDLDDHGERQLNLALNRISGEFDLDKLATVLGDLESAGADMAFTGFTDVEIEKLCRPGPTKGLTDPEAAPDPPAEAATQPGDLITLGDHRLICGDATDPTTVAALFGGDWPFLMITDPPYGVNYDPAYRSNNRTGKVENDDRADWTEAWRLFTGDVAYVWHSSLHVVDVARSLADAGFGPRSYLIWAKERLVMGRGHYHWQHEPCFYAVRSGAAASWCGGRDQATVWSIPSVRPGAADDQETKHGTQKPVECMSRPMRNHGKRGDYVYDPFVGSGTSLIAAELEGRRCLAIELDPVYCDVVVRRWQNFTGQKAEGWRG